MTGEPEPEPQPFGDEDAVTALQAGSPLLLAREYWDAARRIGDPGEPSMVEAAGLQRQHATMASTAALVSIAESLHLLAQAAPAQRRHAAKAAASLETVAKETTKLRAGRRH